MCNKYLSNNSISSFIIETLYKCGVRHACISPGSRNTPLTNNLVNHSDIKCFSHIDERSSAYFGLGIAKALKNPVIIETTSGTATANLYPAVIEASLSKIPLILITADRPKRLINTGESQTIDQINLFGVHVREFIDLDPQHKSITNKLKYLATLIHNYTAENKKIIQGPIHINIRFEEPLLDDNLSKVKINTKFVKNNIKKISFKLPKYKNALIISGPQNDKSETNDIIRLARKINAPILGDILSQLRYNPLSKNINVFYDHYIEHIKILPDIILRFEDKPISKKLSNFLYKHKKITYLIDKNAGYNDDCPNLIKDSLKNIDITNIKKSKQSYLDYFHDLELKSFKLINENILKYNSQAKLLHDTLNQFNENDYIFIGSSTILRAFDAFSNKSVTSINILSNHISRGIDGILSTSLGVAAVNNKTNNFLFIGDVSFFYDINTFHILKDEIINLTIIMINNKGGQIFSRLPYSNKNIGSFEKFWITPLKTSAKNLSKLFNLQYFKINSNEVKDKITSISSKKGVKIVEIKINNSSDVKFLNKISIETTKQLV